MSVFAYYLLPNTSVVDVCNKVLGARDTNTICHLFLNFG